VGAASFAIGREKGKMKAGAKAADMAQGMLDRRDAKRDAERDRFDRLNKETADRNQKFAVEQGRIAQDQDEARMRAEAEKNRAEQRRQEQEASFRFRQNQDAAGREWEWWKGQQKPDPNAGQPPSQFFPNQPSNVPTSPPPFGYGDGFGRGGGYGSARIGGGFGLGNGLDEGQTVPLPYRPYDRPMLLPNDMNPTGGFGGRQFDPRMYTPEQLRQLGRLDSNQGKLSTPDTAHLDQNQKDSVGNRINNERQEILNNPAGQPSPTLDQIVNDSMTGVNFGGQELPIVLGSDGTPKVMEGYKPQDHAGGFENAPQMHRDDPSKLLNDPMLKGLSLPSGDMIPFTVSGRGTFESPPLNPNDAQVFANRYKNQMLPDGKTPKYNVDIVDSPTGSTLSVSPNYPKTQEEEQKTPEAMKTPEQNRMDYVMENWQKMPDTKPNPNYDPIEASNSLDAYPEPKEIPLTTDEKLQMAGEQFDAIDRFKNPPPTEAPAEPIPMKTEDRYGSLTPPPVNEYTGEPRQSVLPPPESAPPTSIAAPPLQQPTQAQPPVQTQPSSVLSQSDTPIQVPTPVPAPAPTQAPPTNFKNPNAKGLYNDIDSGKLDVKNLSNEELMMLLNEPEIYGGQ
jgi:hypothetical protein